MLVLLIVIVLVAVVRRSSSRSRLILVCVLVVVAEAMLTDAGSRSLPYILQKHGGQYWPQRRGPYAHFHRAPRPLRPVPNPEDAQSPPSTLQPILQTTPRSINEPLAKSSAEQSVSSVPSGFTATSMHTPATRWVKSHIRKDRSPSLSNEHGVVPVPLHRGGMRSDSSAAQLVLPKPSESQPASRPARPAPSPEDAQPTRSMLQHIQQATPCL